MAEVERGAVAQSAGIIDGIEVDCPFCEGKFACGRTRADVFLGAHSVPACDDFHRTELTAFVRRVRLALEAEQPS